MPGAGVALRLDDVGAASKRHEVYGLTRVRVGTLVVPFPGNFLFLKYLPPIKRWGPYRELSAPEWEGVLAALETAHARMTVAVTAGWVESDGGVTPFPRKFPAAAGVIREGVRRGLLEIANHGYTHCVLRDRLFRPRLFAGNREFHR
ncbi:MAG: polysaccharide deacetylase family protein, partial [Candidatus Rokubacteria bacterium]|nr:polysaccharide deacetylase family protein [Candidatus Rokubacteria bacterium]